MFEAAEVGSKTEKAEYEREVPGLRVGLINAQYDLAQAPFPVFILVVGDDRVGVNEVVDLLNEWMDARYLDTEVFLDLSEEERERPRFWRYWRALAPRGRIGLFLGAWAHRAIVDRLTRTIDERGLDRRIEHIRELEQALADDGALILKFWLHLPKAEHKKRLKKAKKAPKKQWRIEQTDWQLYDLYGKVLPIAEEVVRSTDTAHAPWHLVESTDRRYRDLTVGRTILEAIEGRLQAEAVREVSRPAEPAATSTGWVPGQASVLDAVDLSARLEAEPYGERLETLQRRLSRLSREAREAPISSVLVFEGWDAAGKGGAIRRLTAAMAARDYRVVPIAAPTDEERARHYLWRFWRQLPRAGRMIIFDRSWYGRVLVERVESFAHEQEWRRAYDEINDFEAQMVEHGMPVLKFWLHIDPDEQLRRFQEREKTPYKKYKITAEDYRNREKWDAYVAAVDEMVARTSSQLAPWTLVPANDKRVARIRVLETVSEGLRRALKAHK